MNGRRILDGEYAGAHQLQPGEYMRDMDGRWWAATPNGLLANLAAHRVIEYANGTVTVSPSILVTQGHADGKRTWHGFLELGAWRTA